MLCYPCVLKPHAAANSMFPFHEDCFVLFENDGDAKWRRRSFEVPSDRVPTPNRFTCTPFLFSQIGFPNFSSVSAPTNVSPLSAIETVSFKSVENICWGPLQSVFIYNTKIECASKTKLLCIKTENNSENCRAQLRYIHCNPERMRWHSHEHVRLLGTVSWMANLLPSLLEGRTRLHSTRQCLWQYFCALIRLLRCDKFSTGTQIVQTQPRLHLGLGCSESQCQAAISRNKW